MHVIVLKETQYLVVAFEVTGFKCKHQMVLGIEDDIALRRDMPTDHELEYLLCEPPTTRWHHGNPLGWDEHHRWCQWSIVLTHLGAPFLRHRGVFDDHDARYQIGGQITRHRLGLKPMQGDLGLEDHRHEGVEHGRLAWTPSNL